jgi:hypothetical protein
VTVDEILAAVPASVRHIAAATIDAVGRGLGRPDDGYGSDAEFLADVSCAECGWTREDAARCEGCNVLGCRCLVVASRDLCDRYSGGDLCEDCIPTYTCAGRCPDCDPPDPRDH